MAISWLAVIYPAGGFLQLTGGDWVVGDLTLSMWFQYDHADFYQHLRIWFALVIIIFTLGVMLFRAARMQEDQEGLI